MLIGVCYMRLSSSQTNSSQVNYSQGCCCIIIQLIDKMIDDERSWFRISIILLNVLSILGCFTILWTFWRVPRFNSNPGTIIKRITIFQLCFSSLLFFSQFYWFPDLSPEGWAFEMNWPLCKFIGFIATMVGTLYDMYNLLLVVNIIMIVRNSGDIFNQVFFKLEVILLMLGLTVSISTLLFSDLQEGILGDCNLGQFSKIEGVMSFLGSFLGLILFILILLIVHSSNRIKITQSIYSTDSDVFQKKYFRNFICINVSYSMTFLITRLVPEMFLAITISINEEWIDDAADVTQSILLASISLGGVLMFIIRANEPIVKKYLKQQFYSRDSNRLVGKLNMRYSGETSNLTDPLNHKDSLEITMYQEASRPVTMESSPLLKFQMTKKFDSLYAIRSVGEFMQILIAVNYAMQDNKESQSSILSSSKRVIRPFLFNYIVQRQCYIKQNPKELEQLLRTTTKSLHPGNQMNINILKAEHSIQTDYGQIKETSYQHQLQDFIDTEYEQGSQTQPSKTRVQTFTYGQDVLLQMMGQGFNISLAQIQKSLDIGTNIQRLQEIGELTDINRFGTIYTTQDGLLTIDLITTAQKQRLVRGGGLMRLYKRWVEARQQAEEDINTYTLLPPIIGLHSIQIDPKRYVTILVKLNPIRLDYPVCERLWDNQSWMPKFIKRNIIGWVTMTPEGIVKRFLANSMTDGKFQIELSRNDFRIQEQALLKLIETIEKDLPLLASMAANFELNFVYCKFSTQRLLSLYKHEQNKESQRDILKPPSSETDLQLHCQSGRKYVGKFPLDSRIGFVKVFFDELWCKHLLPTEEETQQTLERLIAQVNELI